jgi:DNA-binding NarL/FixJ family response regulator
MGKLRRLIKLWDKVSRVPLTALTARQREVAQLLSESHSPKQIADELHLSEKTVQRHRNRICRRLGISPSKDRASSNLAIITRWAVHRHLTHLECETNPLTTN